MNKRVQAMDKARTWKERRTGDYIERLDSSGVVFERTYSPPKPVTRPQAPRPQAPRPQAPKVQPVPQQKNFNYGRPPGLSDGDWSLYQLGELSRKQQRESQLEWFKIMNQTAKESELSNQRFRLQLQSGINNTNVRTKYIDKETAGVIGKSNENVAEIEGKSAGNVAEIEGRTNLGVAKTQAGATKYVSDNEYRGVQYRSDADKYGFDKQFEGLKYQSDRIAETENKKTDSNFFIEREKNATQREKNKQDLFLNAGLGILDSINKQRTSSSQAAAQIYSSYLSSNPYNFKYWD